MTDELRGVEKKESSCPEQCQAENCSLRGMGSSGKRIDVTRRHECKGPHAANWTRGSVPRGELSMECPEFITFLDLQHDGFWHVFPSREFR
jgi:hypothetical protein